jgi:ribonuclease HI
MHLVAHTDGASRGNPGESGIGVVLRTPGGDPVAEFCGYLGRSTNNRAEYAALLACLHLAVRHGCTRLTVHSDSELMVRQVKGLYKIKDAELRRRADEVRSLVRTRGIEFDLRHVDRSLNVEADRLANRAIDDRAPVLAEASMQGWLFQTEG